MQASVYIGCKRGKDREGRELRRFGKWERHLGMHDMGGMSFGLEH